MQFCPAIVPLKFSVDKLAIYFIIAFALIEISGLHGIESIFILLRGSISTSRVHDKKVSSKIIMRTLRIFFIILGIRHIES
jgi:hypothetical protein